MKQRIRSIVQRALSDERGQILPWLAAGMVAFLGVAGLSIDVGHAYIVRTQLQISTDAVALAGAEALPNASGATQSAAQTAAQTSAAALGSTSPSGANYSAALGTVQMKTFKAWCSTTLSSAGIPCSGMANANVVQVTQTANVSTYFLRVVGINSIPVGATATASRAKPLPYNVAVIVDSTLSMDVADGSPSCSSKSQEACALTGVQQLLAGLSPSMDNVSLFTFPNVTANTASIDYCSTLIPNNKGYPNQSPYGNFSMLPVGSWASYSGNAAPWTGLPTSMPYTFPPIGASSYSPSGTVPTYLIAPFSMDYLTSDGGSLNPSSHVVQAAGGKSGCNGIAPPNNDGDYGTYYAGVIYAAQAALLTEQASPLPVQRHNVIIILGDCNSTAKSSSKGSPDTASPGMPQTAAEATQSYHTSTYTSPANYLFAKSSGSYPSWNGECGQAVDAATYVQSQGTQVFTVAYGASTSSNSSNCATDVSAGTHKGISPCTTMKTMSSNPQSTYFYSDYNVTGGDTGCTSPNSVTTLNQIFTAIASDLKRAQLIRNNTQ
jgi:Flp pilus assembly protein TadG